MTPEEIEDLKAKLRSQIGDDVGHVYLPEALYEGALKALTAQAEKIERLQAALRPLAEMAERYDPEDDDGHLECWSRYATPRIRHLRAARAALNGETK